MCVDEFFTVARQSESLYECKKSKFISNVFPVENADEAEHLLEMVRKKHWNATHNVYAYTTGLNNETQRFSDDGEPSGTAGRPVLEVIKANNLRNVLIVVTRYFGGILLGAGGLVRAYSESAARGIKNSGIIRKVNCNIYEIVINYDILGKLQWEFEQRNIKIFDTDYAENVKIKACIPKSSMCDLEKLVLNITSGTAQIQLTGSCFIAVDM